MLSANSTLKSIKISGQIIDSIGEFTVEQFYKSTNDIPLEIVDRDIIEIPHEKLKNIKANVIMSRQV